MRSNREYDYFGNVLEYEYDYFPSYSSTSTQKVLVLEYEYEYKSTITPSLVCTLPWTVSLPTGIVFLNAIVVKIKASHLLIILHPFLPVGEIFFYWSRGQTGCLQYYTIYAFV